MNLKPLHQGDMANANQLPTYFIPHGGGPCFFIKPQDMPPGMPHDIWDPLAAYLRGMDSAIGRRPRAVLVVTAHWMTPRPTVGNAASHHLLYDYYGFPDYTYRLQYPAKGAPDLAARVVELLGAAGIAADTDDRRGIDHGVFIPLMLIYPDADVPVVPISLQRGLDPADHLAIGAALAPLRDEGVLIVGSGMSFHNLPSMMALSHAAEAAAFDGWLAETVEAPDPVRRDAALARWEHAPAARIAHPQEEHLIPLMVAAGAGGNDVGYRSFAGMLGGKPLTGITFGGERTDV
jgi:aromatic ring-opening dioxygenase catalytic subunit (LigB family)